ncbi:MAG: XdhC family protein [Acidobacteria bacterium]|jgi:xanthine dehydrogenase accessory factor|nr:XdhC family protein [Acidobacteriota bacterium]
MAGIYEEILQLKQKGKEGVLVTVIAKEGHAPAGIGTKMLVLSDGRREGTVGGGALEYAAVKKAAHCMKEKNSCLNKYCLNTDNDIINEEQTGMICGGSATLFYEYIGSGTRLYIFGAGHIGKALIYHLKNLNYYVTLIDNREGMADAIEGANRSITANYETVLKDEDIPTESYFIIASHSHNLDYIILKRIYEANWNPKYIGLMASRNKGELMIQQLCKELEVNINLDILYTPVGLDIGGANPDEIAISIISELQAVRCNKNGHKHLKDKSK